MRVYISLHKQGCSLSSKISAFIARSTLIKWTFYYHFSWCLAEDELLRSGIHLNVPTRSVFYCVFFSRLYVQYILEFFMRRSLLDWNSNGIAKIVTSDRRSHKPGFETSNSLLPMCRIHLEVGSTFICRAVRHLQQYLKKPS